MDDMAIIQKMATAILSQVKRAIDKDGHYDRTFTAQVTNVLNNNKVEILYNGNVLKASTSVICTAGDFVRVCAPQNNWSDLFVVVKIARG